MVRQGLYSREETPDSRGVRAKIFPPSILPRNNLRRVYSHPSWCGESLQRCEVQTSSGDQTKRARRFYGIKVSTTHIPLKAVHMRFWDGIDSCWRGPGHFAWCIEKAISPTVPLYRFRVMGLSYDQGDLLNDTEPRTVNFVDMYEPNGYCPRTTTRYPSWLPIKMCPRTLTGKRTQVGIILCLISRYGNG